MYKYTRTYIYVNQDRYIYKPGYIYTHTHIYINIY